MLRSSFMSRLGLSALLFVTMALTGASAAAAPAKKRKPKAPAAAERAPAPVGESPVPSLPPPAPTATAPAPAPVLAATPSPPASASASASAPTRAGRRGLKVDRIGVSLDWFSESSRMTGEQWINSFRADESFDYGSSPIGVNLYVLLRPFEHWRFGPGIRLLGNHGGEQFTFGYLTEAYAMGEFAVPVFEQFEAVFGGRAGLSVLFPGSELDGEIRRLKAEHADVWDVPRMGWVAGLSVGVRRRLVGQLHGRFDLGGQLAHQWLFSTDQVVDKLRFQKSWSTHSRRLGATLGAEVVF